MKCPKCKTTNLIDFYKNKASRSGYSTYCKQCHKAVRKKSFKKHKVKIYNKIKLRIATKREYIDRLYKNKPCIDCNKTYPPCVMDFHHIDPLSKWSDISHLLGSDLSLDRITEEIKKCQLVCSNCHRIRTFGNV